MCCSLTTQKPFSSSCLSVWITRSTNACRFGDLIGLFLIVRPAPVNTSSNDWTYLLSQSRFHQHVLHRLPRDLVPQPPHRLHNFGVSPPSLFADPDDRVADTLLDAGTAWLGVLRLGPVVGGVLQLSDPLAERRVADDRDQLLDPSPHLPKAPVANCAQNGWHLPKGRSEGPLQRLHPALPDPIISLASCAGAQVAFRLCSPLRRNLRSRHGRLFHPVHGCEDW